MKYLFDNDITTKMIVESHDDLAVSITLDLNEGIGIRKESNGKISLSYIMGKEELNQLTGIIHHLKKQLNEK